MSGTTGPGSSSRASPTCCPHHSFVGSTSAAILASIGLDVLGLGVFEAPTLGMTLYWVNFTGAVINGWWWWWLAPIVVVAILFIALFLISIGLDEVANPRLRRRV
jgi:peptide/nickel transport system permease protein